MIQHLIEKAKQSEDPTLRAYAESAEHEYKHITAVAQSLELALDFYANVKNYSVRDGIVPVSRDLGEKARNVLELVRQQRAERLAQIVRELGYE